jgi:hypothetical protein
MTSLVLLAAAAAAEFNAQLNAFKCFIPAPNRLLNLAYLRTTLFLVLVGYINYKISLVGNATHI